MNKDQVAYILSNKPDHISEVRLYLKGRQPMVHSIGKDTTFTIQQKWSMLVLTNTPIQPNLALPYTQFIDVNEIQSIDFIQ